MKASLRWLRELCPGIPDDAVRLGARFTAAGLEVEAVHAFGAGTETCLVASVVSSRPHPSRDGLRLVTVDTGRGRQEVVCGAANVPGAGGLVVLAPLGAHLPAKGLTIERRTIAGVASEGMLCSEAELGLSDAAEGILVLPPDTATPGTPLAQAVPAACDSILDLSLTPNRPDALGHLGLAREAAALFGVPFAPRPPGPPDRARAEPQDAAVTVVIEDADGCPQYGAAVLVDAKVAPSPLDVRWRLAALGVRPISNLVDVTNWVMLEFGHPMHAFDLDRVRGGRITVRRARNGETLATLDGVARSLAPDDLLVCDGEGPVALAGVMGGATSEITQGTARVLLECAYFDPRSVRRSARRHGLHTESSHRFERGVDSGDTPRALARAVEMVCKLAGATAAGGQQVTVAKASPPRTVALSHTKLRTLLGADVSHGDATVTLDRLGFTCRASQPDLDVWELPTHRPDVSRDVDLIEEVARVRGYDDIPAVLPAIAASRDGGPRQSLARRARNAATALGLTEAVTYSFVSPRDLDALGAPPPAVVLRNPLREEQSVMRTSLLPGLLRVVANGRRFGERDVMVFSVGTVFAPSGAPVTDERLGFAAVLAGDRAAWLGKPQPVDVWDAKGLADALVYRLVRREANLERETGVDRHRHLHPRGAAAIEVGGRRVGTLGVLHPEVADAFDLGEGALMVVELYLDSLEQAGVRAASFVARPRFPTSVRDLSVVVRDEVAAGEVEQAVRQAAGELAERVTLFDRFSGGAGIPPGHKSLALRVVYRAADRTLTDAEVDARHAQIEAQVQKQFGGQLRA